MNGCHCANALENHYLTTRFFKHGVVGRFLFELRVLSTCRSNRSSAAASTLSTSGAMGLSEKTFLNPKKMTASKEIRDEKGPSLDDFDKEIEIYQVCAIRTNFFTSVYPCRLIFELTVKWTMIIKDSSKSPTRLGCLHCPQQTNYETCTWK